VNGEGVWQREDVRKRLKQAIMDGMESNPELADYVAEALIAPLVRAGGLGMLGIAVVSWDSISPGEAAGINLKDRPDISAPRNEKGERCPWPWDPQRRAGVPMGQYRCRYCGALVTAGQPHFDYA
jgi:hypothetical protein